MFGITSGTILDVAIGLAVMYLMFSLVATTINEMVATVTALRSKYLGSAIEAIIDHPPLKLAFYDSGIIAAVQAAVNSRSNAGVRAALKSIARVQGAANRHPAYIASDDFALALINSLDPSKPLPVFSDVQQSVEHMPDCNIRDVLLAQIVAANGDLDKLRTGVATWYDAAMDRVSGVYKQDMKYISVVVGILLAIAFNANSVLVTRTLWQDPKLREEMVTLADDQLKNPAGQEAQIPSGPVTKEELDAKLSNIQEKISAADAALNPLPIGWSVKALSVDPTTWIERIIGWLVTGLAVSLGAPFWFDLLSKFMNIRGTGDKPAKASDFVRRVREGALPLLRTDRPSSAGRRTRRRGRTFAVFGCIRRSSRSAEVDQGRHRRRFGDGPLRADSGPFVVLCASRQRALPDLWRQFAFNRALEGVLRVRRVAHTGVNPGAVIEHAACVGERLETPPAVVPAVFPPANAATSGANNSMNGSFQAPMMSVTPNGSRRTRT